MNKAEVAAFVAQVAREVELARIDQVLLGHVETRDGRRVPPWALDTPVAFLNAWLWPDPLAFIGRAANEGES